MLYIGRDGLKGMFGNRPMQTRKLTVAVWYLLMGQWTPLEEIDERLEVKVSKIISRIGGAEMLKKLGKTRQQFREQAYQGLKNQNISVLGAKVYVHHADGQITLGPKAPTQTSA